jgi:putative glutamine amidotransferase
MSAPPRPIVGVTCIDVSATETRPPRLGQNRAYVDAIVRAGGVPLLIPHLLEPTHLHAAYPEQRARSHLPEAALLRAAYDVVDAVLLPGGEDVDPQYYGEAPHEKCGPPSPARDATELALARWAIAEGKPLLAICRGIQVLNVALGGSLYQDIGAQLPGAGRHDWYPGHPRSLRPHKVVIEPDSRLAALADSPVLAVNSLHHQSVKTVADGLRSVAHAPDGVLEALEAPDHPFAVAVQWHPEELAGSDRRAQRLFDALVEAARATPPALV